MNFIRFHSRLKLPEGHGKRHLKYLVYISSRQGAPFLILIRNVFCDRRLWKLRFPQIFDLVARGERGAMGKEVEMPSCTFNTTRGRRIVRASRVVTYKKSSNDCVVYAADQLHHVLQH